MYINISKSKSFYKILLLLAALIWGSSFIVVKNALGSLPPAFIMTLRFTLAFIIMLILFIKKLKNINKGILISGTEIGVVMALSYYFQNLGLKYTTPSKNAFLTSSYCIIVPFLFWFTGKAKPDRYNIIAAALCVLGIGLISMNEEFTLGKGDLITLLGGLFVAFQIVAVSLFAEIVL